MQAPPRGTSPQLLPTQVAGAVHWFAIDGSQLLTQAAPSHRPGAQFMLVGVTHVPLPLQVEAGTSVDVPMQLAALQFVPDGWTAHRPPAHWPVVPHVVAVWTGHRLSAPDCTGEQVPRVAARLQDWQAPVQALLQQTPCAQKLLPHSSAAAHGWPSPFLPHEPAAV